MITATTFYGDGIHKASTGNIALTRNIRLWEIAFSGGGSHDLTLPDARDLPLGFFFMLFGTAGSDSYTLKDNGGTGLVAMNGTSKRLVSLVDNSTAAGQWAVK